MHPVWLHSPFGSGRSGGRGGEDPRRLRGAAPHLQQAPSAKGHDLPQRDRAGESTIRHESDLTLGTDWPVRHEVGWCQLVLDSSVSRSD